MSITVIDADNVTKNDDFIIIHFAFLNNEKQVNKEGKIFVDLSINNKEEKIVIESSDRMIVGALEILTRQLGSDKPDGGVLKIGFRFLTKKVTNILKVKNDFDNVAIGIIKC